ncbi:hypothetical protein ACFSCV_10150 [Methylopila henanensis]|uniref:Uncharacterized protein n=1 Tax=Methylopila henanensis TaxID=873516 RepID=A0ABW4K5B8_9HYPH
MREVTTTGLAMAGLAAMGAAGGRRCSLNAVAYGSRARRRAFEREADRLKARLEAELGGPVTGWPESEEECEAVAAELPPFREFLDNMRALATKWFG